jgi:hypothetical protein
LFIKYFECCDQFLTTNRQESFSRLRKKKIPGHSFSSSAIPGGHDELRSLLEFCRCSPQLVLERRLARPGAGHNYNA